MNIFENLTNRNNIYKSFIIVIFALIILPVYLDINNLECL